MVELRKRISGNWYELSVVTTFSNPAHILCVNIELNDELTILDETTDCLKIDGKKATACRVRFFVERVIQEGEEEKEEEEEGEGEGEEKEEEQFDQFEQSEQSEPDYASWFKLDLVKDV
jgi:hypothetical protein